MNKTVYFLAFVLFLYLSANECLMVIWTTVAQHSEYNGIGLIPPYLMLGAVIAATLVLYWKYRATPNADSATIAGADFFDSGLRLFGVIMAFQSAQGFISDGGFIFSSTGALGELRMKLLSV